LRQRSARTFVFHAVDQNVSPEQVIDASNDDGDTPSPFDFIFPPVEENSDRHQGERDPQDDSLAGGD
jgi:hypothetical protein